MALMMSEQEISRRVELAKQLFHSGYNCAQSVVIAYADLLGFTEQMAASVAAGFGAGMGRMRMTCGAFSGAVIVAGFLRPIVAENPQTKAENYALVQQMAAEFKSKTGSLICAELLGLNKCDTAPVPQPRTEEYYKKRPCSEMVAIAAEIVGKQMQLLIK